MSLRGVRFAFRSSARNSASGSLFGFLFTIVLKTTQNAIIMIGTVKCIVLLWGEVNMFFQMFQGKHNKRIAGVIIIAVVAAMVLVPLVVSLLGF